MPDETIYFKNVDDLVVRLTKVFSYLDPNDLRNLLFAIGEFKEGRSIPEDASIYLTDLPLEGLEVLSRNRVSDVLIGGMDKFKKLNYQKKNIPPLIVVKGGIRMIIVYGEMYAIEAYLRNLPARVIVFDIDEQDPFEVFKLNSLNAVFLVPLIEESMGRKNE